MTSSGARRLKTPAERVAALDTRSLAAELDERGCARTGKLLSARECRTLAALYDNDDAFRSRVVMARHGFGRGEYRYLAYPLPDIVQRLRESLYALIAPIANHWQELLGAPALFPQTLDQYLRRCHRAGQTRPTPLILSYGPGDFNCLHQDVYGDWVFPLQATVLLSRPDADFSGGELMLVENRPRRQARGRVVKLRQGEGVIFPVNHRPVSGKRGYYRATMRHGVSPLDSGRRYALGIIFHDAA